MLDQKTIEAEVGIAGTVSDDVLKRTLEAQKQEQRGETCCSP